MITGANIKIVGSNAVYAMHLMLRFILYLQNLGCIGSTGVGSQRERANSVDLVSNCRTSHLASGGRRRQWRKALASLPGSSSCGK